MIIFLHILKNILHARRHTRREAAIIKLLHVFVKLMTKYLYANIGMLVMQLNGLYILNTQGKHLFLFTCLQNV